MATPGTITMTMQEVDRLKVIQSVVDGHRGSTERKVHLSLIVNPYLFQSSK